MTNPKFHVLDVVSLAHSPSAEPWGTVTEVRRYNDGQLRYSVAPLDPDGIGTIFDEGDLMPTGRRAQASEFTMIGGLHDGEIVTIRNTTALVEIAGMSGIVVGGSHGGESIAVWIDDLAEVWSVPHEDLEATGRRVHRERPERATSLRISQTGGILGSDEYEVLEDVADS